MKKNNQNNPSVPAPAPAPVSVPVAIKSYPNSDTCKAQILSENPNKSGIYM
jgi:hypothetical protein